MAEKLLSRKINWLSSYLSLDLNYFVGGGFWLVAGNVISVLSGIILSSLFARIWHKETYGQFSFLMSLMGIASVLALPGMSQAVTQATSEGKDGVFKKACRAVALWSMAGVVFLVIIASYFYLNGARNLSLSILVSALLFPVISGASLYNSFLAGKKLFKQVAIFGSLAQIVSILATAIALVYWPSLIAVSFFSAASTAVINIILTVFAFKHVANNQSDESTIKMGVHLSFSQFFTISADFLDRLFIPLFLGFTNNAVYAFAILVPMQMHAFLKIFTTLGQPKVARIDDRQIGRDLLNKSLQLEFLILILVVAYIVAAPYIFSILYPAYSESAVGLSQVFSLSLLYFPSNLFGLGLVKKRDSASIYKLNISYFVLTILSLFAFVPTFGLWGAVLSKVAVRLVQAFLQFFLFKKAY